MSVAADPALSQTVEQEREPSQDGAVRLIDIDAEDESGFRKRIPLRHNADQAGGPSWRRRPCIERRTSPSPFP